VQVGGQTVVADMSSGSATVDLGSDDAHFVIDPMYKVLRYDPAIARWREWMAEQQKKEKEKEKVED
ncbi:MAG: hypothetical protein JKY75_01030, partial [Erythrobacter sp.]|nr:hypothetical protein [Erythrobacter sp.]